MDPTKSAESAITELLFTYAERVDAGDFDGVAALFADGEVSAEGYPGVERGTDAVRRYFERSTRRYDDGTPKTKHVMTNVIVDVDGSEGTTRSYFTVLQAVPGALALQPIIAGRYRDRFARGADGAWHFAARHIVIDLVGDLGQHLLFELPRP